MNYWSYDDGKIRSTINLDETFCSRCKIPYISLLHYKSPLDSPFCSSQFESPSFTASICQLHFEREDTQDVSEKSLINWPNCPGHQFRAKHLCLCPSSAHLPYITYLLSFKWGFSIYSKSYGFSEAISVCCGGNDWHPPLQCEEVSHSLC